MKSNNQKLYTPYFTFHNFPIEDYRKAVKSSTIYDVQIEIKRILKERTGHDFTDCLLFDYRFKKQTVDFMFMFKSWMEDFWKELPEEELIIEKNEK